ALSGFKNRSIRVLVATDIAARGLDIEGLPHVVNFELPNVAEDYVHRIGRTGRAGVEGHAVSLVSPDEVELLQAIEKLLKRKIELVTAQGYDGEVPEDIARDEAERDKARAQERERLRQSRRQGADKAKKSVKKNAVAAEVETLVKEENKKAKVSDNPADRFEKKIRRKAPEVIAKVAQTVKHDAPKKPSRQKDGRKDSSQDRFDAPKSLGRHRDTRHLGDAKRDDSRRSARPRAASYAPVDPFAPQNQAIYLPQSMPGNTSRGKRNESAWKRQDAKTNSGRSRGNGFGVRRNEGNIKSTVTRRADARQDMRDDRFESVSSNLPPGMVLRYRRR
ncbi:MAG: DEAD/DEAH box helicase, partial [Sutterellaceae bacterium]|nr:DEAD/DEAH box helicase [Sutterellaceae bacterium]